MFRNRSFCHSPLRVHSEGGFRCGFTRANCELSAAERPVTGRLWHRLPRRTAEMFGSSDPSRPFTRLAPGNLRNFRQTSGFIPIVDEYPDERPPTQSPKVAPPPARSVVVQSPAPHGSTPPPAVLTKQSTGSQRRLANAIRHKAIEEALAMAKNKKFEPEEQRRAACKIQRWYRELNAMYAAFGPMMFSCKDGRMADFGSISYLSGSRTARFIRVADT